MKYNMPIPPGKRDSVRSFLEVPVLANVVSILEINNSALHASLCFFYFLAFNLI